MSVEPVPELAVASPTVPAVPVDRRPRVRGRLLGWSASSVPVAPLLLLGMALGPRALAVLSTDALAVIDPVIPVALAALGVLVGLGVADWGSTARRLRAGGGWHALWTAVIAAAGMMATGWTVSAGGLRPWLLPVACGICAASALTLPGRSASEPRRSTDALIESEAAVSIALGAMLLLALLHPSLPAAALFLVQELGLAGLLVLAGWLLARRTISVTERRVFGMASLLMVGGVADVLSCSALLAGLVAGLTWSRLGGLATGTLHGETLYLQHPLVVLVLLVAGARTGLSPLVVALAAAYVSLRALARFLGGRVLQRAVAPGATALPLQLVAPGVFGVAFALNVSRVPAADAAHAAMILSVVVVGTVLSDLTAHIMAVRGERA